MLLKTLAGQLANHFRLEKQMRAKIAIPHGSPHPCKCREADSNVSRAVGLKHCLDEIDNTIKPVPVRMHHYDPLLHQPLLVEHTSLALGTFGREKKQL